MFRPALAALCALSICFAASPAHAQSGADRQSGVLLDAFMTICALNPGNTDAAAAAAEKTGFSAKGGLAEKIGEPMRIYSKSTSKGPVKLVLSETPWRCMVSTSGPTLRGIGEALGLLGNLLQAEPGNSKLKLERQSDYPLEEIHTVVSLDTEDGGHEVYSARAGGSSFAKQGMFMLEYTPPYTAPEFTSAFKTNFLSKIDASAIPTRNSLIALNLIQKLCLEMYGDFDGANDWAATHLVPDERQATNTDKTISWMIADKDVTFTLMITREDRKFCKLNGGPVDANAVHDGFRALKDGWPGPGGYSFSPNGFTDREYEHRPNDMPGSRSYYSGGVFHSPQKPGGIDAVLSTKRTEGFTSLVADIQSVKVEEE